MHKENEILSLDLDEVTLDDISSWFEVNNQFSTELVESVKKIIQFNMNSTDYMVRIQRIYIQYNYILALSKWQHFTIEYCPKMHEQLKLLRPIEVDEKVNNFMDKFMLSLITLRTIVITESECITLLHYQQIQNVKSLHIVPDIFNDVFCIDVSKYDITLKLITKFPFLKPIFEYYKTKGFDVSDATDVTILKIYFKGDKLFAHLMKLKGNNEEVIWHSRHFDQELIFKPIIKIKSTIEVECELSLNTILEKINATGMNSLNRKELAFLENI